MGSSWACPTQPHGALDLIVHGCPLKLTLMFGQNPTPPLWNRPPNYAAGPKAAASLCSLVFQEGGGAVVAWGPLGIGRTLGGWEGLHGQSLPGSRWHTVLHRNSLIKNGKQPWLVWLSELSTSL